MNIKINLTEKKLRKIVNDIFKLMEKYNFEELLMFNQIFCHVFLEKYQLEQKEYFKELQEHVIESMEECEKLYENK